jgi:molybdenum cofactor guanylyltransferase
VTRSVVYGLVLAGGSSRRMYQDKAALLYDGAPQLIRAGELLQRHCAQVFVSARTDQQDELRSRWPMIVDQHTDLGPLAGIAAAQAKHPDVAWLVIACDQPLLNDASLKQLLQQRDPARPATAFRSPLDHQPEPLCALWEPASAPLIRNAIAAGEFSPRQLLKTWDTLQIDPSQPETLSNVNTPAEYQQASALLEARSLAQAVTLQLQYFAILREQAGKRSEAITTTAQTPAALYAELQQRYGFTLGSAQLKIAINNEFCDWQQRLKSGDVVTFIPPVAGG